MGLLLVVAFLVIPVVEIYVIIQVGGVIGVPATVVLLLLESLLGAWLVKREGRRAWQAVRGAFGSGRLPTGELADAALVLVGGTLLLTPGFVTDIVGFFLVIPLTRPLARRVLGWLVARRTFGAFGPAAGRARTTFASGDAVDRPAPGPGAARGTVLRGEVVNEKDEGH